MKVICQICQEIIAVTEVTALSYPLKGSMFDSPDPVHGFPAPFAPADGWEEMRCPYGRIQGENGQIGGHRPFIKDDEILIATGIYRISHEGQVPEPPSDEEAERMVRAGIQAGDTLISGGTAAKVATVVVEKERKIITLTFPCPTCGKVCKNKFGLTGHMRSHKKK